MRRTPLLPLIATAACAASAAELHTNADRDNPRALADAVDRFVHARGLEPFDAPPLGAIPSGPEAPPPTPIAGHPRLISLSPPGTDPPTIELVEDSCAVGDSCGCDVGADFRYFLDGARIVVARMVPDVEVRRIVHAGSCAEGCGVQAPQVPPPVRSLGAIDPAQVEVVDVHYHYDQIVETCDHPLPAP
jgi:hypothetical protein